MRPKFAVAALAGVFLLGACTTLPTGPSVLVLPGTGKPFDQFRGDEIACRQYAGSQTGTTPSQAASDAGMKSAVVGTAVGAVAGAAIGGRRGAAVGAGSGLLIGSVAGSEAARSSAYGSQRYYDHAYIQCMYAQGHRVPVPGGMVAPGAQAMPPPPPPPPPPPR